MGGHQHRGDREGRVERRGADRRSLRSRHGGTGRARQRRELHGAHAASQPKPAFAINLDIFGYGNAFFATASQPEGRLARSLSRAAEAGGIAVRFSDAAHYPLSDHHNMIAAGIETLGIALIDGAEVDGIMAGGNGPPPRVLTIIHTPKDAIDVLNVAEVARGTQAIEQLLRLVDSGGTNDR